VPSPTINAVQLAADVGAGQPDHPVLAGAGGPEPTGQERAAVGLQPVGDQGGPVGAGQIRAPADQLAADAGAEEPDHPVLAGAGGPEPGEVQVVVDAQVLGVDLGGVHADEVEGGQVGAAQPDERSVAVGQPQRGRSADVVQVEDAADAGAPQLHPAWVQLAVPAQQQVPQHAGADGALRPPALHLLGVDRLAARHVQVQWLPGPGGSDQPPLEVGQVRYLWRRRFIHAGQHAGQPTGQGLTRRDHAPTGEDRQRTPPP
jgi:hypothetical protein